MVTFDFKKYQYRHLDDYRLDYVKERFLADNKMAGWYDLDRSELDSIKKTAEYVRNNCDVFVVIGIGGSYLGAKAVIDALDPYFKENKPEIIFAGYQLSSDYIKGLLDYIKDKDVMINVISKSGTTLEPAIAFSLLMDFMQQKYGDDISKRVIATTDEKEGTLLELAKTHNFTRFVVPSNIGGRFSVLTPVGLLPIAVAGYDIDKLFDGAEKAKSDEENYYYYTKLRHELYEMNKVVESFNVYEPKLESFAEWLKQLFGESQGKEGKGILPFSTVNTRDLHSLGQYFQDGIDMLFSTTIFANSSNDVELEEYNHRTLNEINLLAMESVAESHYNGHVPTSIITLDKINEENLGYLIFFFEMSAMLGSYLLEINYYDQPGVNGYKDILHAKIKG